jgi:uncharacterized damage-inducible protein DinB
MPATDSLTVLFRHNQWANLRLLERCAQLTDEQLDASAPGGFGPIRDTLRHMAGSERSYFSRISTGQRSRGSEDIEAMTIAELAQVLRASGDGLIEWAPRVQPADTVVVDWDGSPRDVPKTILLTQAINHATEHRAQIMVSMTQLGIQPPDLDGWQYFDESDR